MSEKTLRNRAGEPLRQKDRVDVKAHEKVKPKSETQVRYPATIRLLGALLSLCVAWRWMAVFTGGLTTLQDYAVRLFGFFY